MSEEVFPEEFDMSRLSRLDGEDIPSTWEDTILLTRDPERVNTEDE